jgi:c-di-GMP phosphodiesterase
LPESADIDRGQVRNEMQESLAKDVVNVASRYPAATSVARIPILDGWNRVHAYRLFFWDYQHMGDLSRRGPQSFAGKNSRVEVEIVARGLPAFIHCKPDVLDSDWVSSLPAQLTVLEVGNDAAMEAIAPKLRSLRAAGFRVAVDSVPEEGSALWALADYIMVDTEHIAAADRLKLVGKMRDSQTQLIAMNVETQAEYRERFDQGFDFFQGNYIFRPEPLPIPKIPPNRMVHLEILEVLQKDPVDIDRLSQLIKCDASLTYRLLRLVNSPLCATRQEITSIKAALLLLGENTARRFATMALAAEFNADQPSEILRISMERARFCELASTLAGQDSAEQYLIGLISMFPAMLRMPMDELLKHLPLRDLTRSVLLGQECPESLLLDWLEYHERGDWERCEGIVQSRGLNMELMIQRHAEATAWADLVLFNAM